MRRQVLKAEWQMPVLYRKLRHEAFEGFIKRRSQMFTAKLILLPIIFGTLTYPTVTAVAQQQSQPLSDFDTPYSVEDSELTPSRNSERLLSYLEPQLSQQEQIKTGATIFFLGVGVAFILGTLRLFLEKSVAKKGIPTSEIEKSKNEIILKLAQLLPPSIGFQDSISPEKLAQISKLLAQINIIKSIYPELSFSPSEYEYQGKASFLEDNYYKALTYFEKALTIRDNFPEAWYGKGVVWRGLGRYIDALECFDKALELNPNYVEAQIQKSFVLYDLNAYQLSLDACDKALKIQPDNYILWYLKGNIFRVLNKYKDAIESYDMTLKIKPNFVYAIYGKARSYALQHETKLALENLKRAIELQTGLRELAKTESDFKNIQDSEEFKKLVSI